MPISLLGADGLGEVVVLVLCRCDVMRLILSGCGLLIQGLIPCNVIRRGDIMELVPSGGDILRGLYTLTCKGQMH